MSTQYMSFSQRTALETLLRAAGLDVSLDFDRTSNILNTKQKIPNPTPQGTVPQAISFDQITAGLEASTVQKLCGNGLVGEFSAAVDAQAHAKITQIIGFWSKGSILTVDEIATVTALTSATMPDPSWPPTIDGKTPFDQALPNFECYIDNTKVTQCHPALVKEALGVA